ncbi:MAG: LD-carboxypeptidase [Proteobacteria bacterium]|nr:LD-carboxypeptidase [Pseudomonadota bacterium]
MYMRTGLPKFKPLEEKNSMKFKIRLNPGDLIGVTSVTAPAEKERLDRGVGYLEQLGYRVRLPFDPTLAYGTTKFLFGSETPQQRAAGLTGLFCDPEVKAIFATRGSYGAVELLEHLDLSLISKHPKPLIGFSDITALLIPLSQRAGCPVIHGPVVEFGFGRAAEGKAGPLESVGLTMKVLTGEEVSLFEAEPLTHLYGPRACSGEVMGGNLSIVASLMGTRWAPDFRGKILFLEDIGEPPYRVHRMLTQLKYAGAFEEVAGIVLGDFTRCEHPKNLGPSVHEALADALKGCTVPVYSGLPCGHEIRNLPLPFAQAQIADGRLRYR